MKLTLSILACMVLTATHAASYTKGPISDKSHLERQKFLLDITNSIDTPLQNENLIPLGGHLITDQTKYYNYGKYMSQFEQAMKSNSILQRGKFYAPLESKIHFAQGQGLANFLFYAKDFDTFVRNTVWARLNVNEGMFVYALNYACMHRKDMSDLFLPPIYEILPQSFFTTQLVQKAQQFNTDVVNKQQILGKEMSDIYQQNQGIQQQIPEYSFKVYQWWKLMGFDDGFHVEHKNFQRNDIEQQVQNPVYQSALEGVQKIWTPADYTRNIENVNHESKLSYFTEDVGLNAYWYYASLNYAPFMTTQEVQQYSNNKFDNRGEKKMFQMQQLLARYYVERLSHGLGKIDELSLHGVIKNGYNPQLISYNGVGYSVRQNYFHVESIEKPMYTRQYLNIENRILDAIDSGKVTTKTGQVIDLTTMDSADIVAKMILGSIDIPNAKYYGSLLPYMKSLLAGAHTKYHTVTPNVLQNYETILRDPVTYQMFKRAVKIYHQYKNHLPSYTKDQLITPGVKIVDVQTSNLKTFFDLVDVDVTTLTNDKPAFQNGNLVVDHALVARQLRLNHKPFTIDIKVQSDKTQQVVVRVFYAPVLNEFGEKIPTYKLQQNAVQLDQFVHTLQAGDNIITRNSKDNSHLINDPMTTTEVYNHIMQAYEGKQGLPQEIFESPCGFPDRLILPHGCADGLPLRLFVMITPAQGVQQNVNYQQNSCGVNSQQQIYDDLPYGFPFDREIVDPMNFIVPNFHAMIVNVYHSDKLGQYSAGSYEYGKFDYSL